MTTVNTSSSGSSGFRGHIRFGFRFWHSMALAPAWVVIRVCYLSNIFFSPDFLANGSKPPVFSLPNPAFVYGWIVPKQELHEAIYGEPCVQWTDLEYIPGAVKQTFKEEWLAKGYRKSNYKWVFRVLEFSKATYKTHKPTFTVPTYLLPLALVKTTS